MSGDTNQQTANLWMDRSYLDLESARVLLDRNLCPTACFHAQQVAEKGLKALSYYKGEGERGHKLTQLMADLEPTFPQLNEFYEIIQRLEEYYLPTRYPDVYDDVSYDPYHYEEAKRAVEDAERLYAVIRNIIPI